MSSSSETEKHQMEETRKWKEMERDCLANIFQRLDVFDLIISLPFVCKSWSSASADPCCWKILDFRSFDLMPWSELGKRFTTTYPLSLYSFSPIMKYAVRRSCGSVVELHFPKVYAATWEDLIYASNECPRLKILDLPILTREDEVPIPELVGKWKELEFLDMKSKPASFPKLCEEIGINCKKFTGLKIVGSIQKEDAMAIVNHLPRIKCLNLSKSYLPKEQLLFILNGFRVIERLSVNDCIGFEADDEEVLKMGEEIKIFENQGSKLTYDFDCDSDECDPFYVQVL